LHIRLAAKEYAIPGFGVLKGFREHSHNGSVALASLEFRVQTGHFIAASQFPLADEIRSRVALLRLIAFPLISYNHFHVEHIGPWEPPLEDTEFWGRFWAGKAAKVPCSILEDTHARGIEAVQLGFQHMKWNQLTPWRLAINRLDDALFKLECGSPDCILDLVIGLESLFVEAESRQESTHKVATRAARFLETAPDIRRDTFRKVKKIYKTRSTLAHGQKLELDAKGLGEVEEAALLLSRALLRMVELGRVQLDVLGLDLV
jgi:Apea-like HEPN